MTESEKKRLEMLTKIRIEEDYSLSHDKKKLEARIEKVKDLTKDVKPLYHPTDLIYKKRPDIKPHSLSSQDALLNSKSNVDGYFSSVKVI